jgi:hypothetical protein
LRSSLLLFPFLFLLGFLPALGRIVIDVKSGAFEDKVGGRDQLPCRSQALRASDFTIFIDLMEDFENFSAAIAFVLINWHKSTPFYLDII